MSTYVVDDTLLQPWFDELEDLSKVKSHTAMIANPIRYAEYLHNREGYFVFNDDMMVKLVEEWIFRGLVASQWVLKDETIEQGIEAGLRAYVDWLRESSFQFGTRPPRQKGEGPRAAHRGKWADWTGTLNRGYFFTINGKAQEAIL